jgi:teichuronic acid biosynthesis protein TuaE
MNRFYYTFHYHSLIKAFIISVAFGSAIGYGHLYFFHIILVLVYFVLLLENKKIITYGAISNRYFYIPLSILLWYLLGIAWSHYKLDTLRYIVYLLLGISVIFIFATWATTSERFKYALKYIKNIVFIEFIVSFLEIFRIFRWPTSPYSKYAPLFNRNPKNFSYLNDKALLVIESMPTGFSGNPNDLAVLIVMVLPFFLFSQKFYIRILGIILSLIIIGFTGSRGVFIAFCIGMIVYFFMQYRRLFFTIAITLCLFISTGLASSILDTLKISENNTISKIAIAFDVLTTYLTKKSNSGDSISLRQQLIENGMIEFKATKGLGVGGGASPSIQQFKYGIDSGSMHNFWIEILIEGGLLGFSLFVSWYLLLMYKLLSVSKQTKDNHIKYISRSIFLSMVFFSIGCVSASSVIYNLNMWLMFGMGISIIYINKCQKAK